MYKALIAMVVVCINSSYELSSQPPIKADANAVVIRCKDLPGDIVFVADDRVAVVGYKKIDIWDLKTQKIVKTIEFEKALAPAIAFDKPNKCIVVGFDAVNTKGLKLIGASLEVISLESGKSVRSLRLDEDFSILKVHLASDGEIVGVECHSFGSGGIKRWVKLLSYKTLKAVGESGVGSSAFANHESVLLGDDGLGNILSIKGKGFDELGKFEVRLKKQADAIRCSPDDGLVGFRLGSEVYLYEMANGKEQRVLKVGDQKMHDFAFLSSKIIGVGLDDGRLVLFRSGDGMQVGELKGKGAVLKVARLPDGEKFAILRNDNSISVHSLKACLDEFEKKKE